MLYEQLPFSGLAHRPKKPSTNNNQKKKRRGNTKVWYKFKEAKKATPPLLRLPDEVLLVVFQNVFTEVHMVDVKITQPGSIQRRYGAQSLLFVCKALRGVAEAAMLRYATFEIPHFKLHEKHRRENKMKTLHKIQHLVLLWTPPPSASFTTKRGDDAYILQTFDHLRSLKVWLLANQYVRLETS